MLKNMLCQLLTEDYKLIKSAHIMGFTVYVFTLNGSITMSVEVNYPTVTTPENLVLLIDHGYASVKAITISGG